MKDICPARNSLYPSKNRFDRTTWPALAEKLSEALQRLLKYHVPLATCHSIRGKFLSPYWGLQGEWINQTNKETHTQETHKKQQKAFLMIQHPSFIRVFTLKVQNPRLKNGSLCNLLRKPLKFGQNIFTKSADPLTFSTRPPITYITCKGGNKIHTKPLCFHDTWTRQRFTTIRY